MNARWTSTAVGLAGAALAVALVAVAAADELENDAVYVPVAGASSLVVQNPLGAVHLRGWDRSELRVIASKRAGASALLERLKVRVDLVDGRVVVTTGFYLDDRTFNSLPLGGAAIDLTIDAPRTVALAAATFAGDVEAEGFRAGARLSSQEGRIRVADVAGPVDTRTLDGKQWLSSIRGPLLASGVDGDLELAAIDGDTVEATAVNGRIVAREVRARLVRLRSTHGTIVLVGALRPDGRYELSTRDGDLRLRLRPAPFQVVMRAKSVRSDFALVGGVEGPGVRSGAFLAGTALALDERAPVPSLRLVSATGEVALSPE